MPSRVHSRQLVIIHLSDVHFGSRHSFNPPPTSEGDRPRERDYPTLLDKLREDLAENDPGCPVLIAVTGDMAQVGTFDELSEAEKFLRGLTDLPILGRQRSLDDVFLVPGNHDVLYTKSDVAERWHEWHGFYNRLRGLTLDPREPWALDAVADRVDDLGAVIVTVNSAIHVEQGKDDEIRGRVDQKQIEAIQQQLEAIDEQRLATAIRIALIHHHPVLIPALVEPGRHYDAVHNSALLLNVLRKFGFHVLLHGHKHNPHVFTEDAMSAYRHGEPQPILIVAGGSAGSTELPTSPPCGNCYNRIVVKWNSGVDQTRIRITTRGLKVRDADGTDLLPWRWEWQTLRSDDRQFIRGDEVPSPKAMDLRPFDDEGDQEAEADRFAEYQRLHWYFPVAAVMPSLHPDQVNEARLWIVRHSPPNGVDPGPSICHVTWSAGKRFALVRIAATEDPKLCAVVHYYGPMLIQATMEFEDGQRSDAYLYVRLPEAIG